MEKKMKNDHSEIEHQQEFHDPEDIRYYPQRDLLCYVEHDSDVFTEDNLTTGALLDQLKLQTGYKLPEGIKPDVPAARLPSSLEANQSRHTLFCLRSENLDIAGDYDRLYKLITKGDEIKLDNGKGTVRSVFPNWFNGIAAHVSIGSHGPGGPPRPVINDATLGELDFDLPEFIQAAQLTANGTALAQKEVVVYILDTLPVKERLYGALQKYPELDRFQAILPAPLPEGDPIPPADRIDTPKAHYLYVSETGTNFDETYSSLVPQPHPYSIGNHAYDSSDHGLFIAGIVHLIASKAKIYVIQVINDNGVGTFLNYAAGFHKVVELHRTENPNAIPIVNCSFTLSIPVDGHDAAHLDATLSAYTDEHVGFKPQMEAFTEALNGTLLTSAKVFAASGNDSSGNGTNSTTHLQARYPAKFEHVIGVGSVKWNRQNRNQRDIADYSNRADNPQSEGFYVYGGQFRNDAAKGPNQRGKQDFEDGGDGVISIFTGNLDIEVLEAGHAHDVAKAAAKKPTNLNGLAEWKGTSFATPIMAATVALLCSEWGITPDEALVRIDQQCDKSNGMRKFKFGKQRHQHVVTTP
jgi:hypothetical protein